jgi:hypothetical protein
LSVSRGWLLGLGRLRHRNFLSVVHTCIGGRATSETLFEDSGPSLNAFLIGTTSVIGLIVFPLLQPM